jgi:hypothetical protein
MRAVAPRGAQVVAAEVQAVGRQQALGVLVVERCPLELEEQQARLDRRALLLIALEQRAVLGRGGVHREAQVRIGARTGGEVLDGAELAHRLDQPGAIERGDLAGVALGERIGARLGVGEHTVDGRLGVVGAAVQERAEVPADRVKRGIGGWGGGHAS